MDEVVAPDVGDVGAGGFDSGDGEAFCFEVGDELAVGFEEAVLGAAGDPEEAEVRCLCGVGRGEHGKLGCRIEEVDGGAEAADGGELPGVIKADLQALEATHGEAGDGLVFALSGDGVLGFDTGKDFGEECL